MKNNREILAAIDQIEDLLRSVDLSLEQREHYEREKDELKARLKTQTTLRFRQSL